MLLERELETRGLGKLNQRQMRTICRNIKSLGEVDGKGYLKNMIYSPRFQFCSLLTVYLDNLTVHNHF